MAITPYKVRSSKKDGGTTTVFVETAERTGRGETSLGSGNDKIVTDEMNGIVEFASGVLEQFKALQPKEIKLEFGVELGSGNPFVTQGLNKATFKVTLDWSASA